MFSQLPRQQAFFNYKSNPLMWFISILFVQLVKVIRQLVDNGEFLATRHCPSNECRLIMTLLLELITDYSREVKMDDFFNVLNVIHTKRVWLVLRLSCVKRKMLNL